MGCAKESVFIFDWDGWRGGGDVGMMYGSLGLMLLICMNKAYFKVLMGYAKDNVFVFGEGRGGVEGGGQG